MSRATQWRVVDDLDDPPDAVGQMAADERLLARVAAGGESALRLYRWARPTLSLGRFQPLDDVDAAACAERGVEVVRRPTGGRALLHGADLTYAVAMPRPAGAAGRVDAVYRTIAAGLVRGLAMLSVEADVAAHAGEPGPVCFASALGSDLRVGDAKLCGSAQVQRGSAVLQHGSVLLDRLAFDETDLLRFDDDAGRTLAAQRLRNSTVTLRELGVTARQEDVAQALVAGFADALGLDLDWRSRISVAATGVRR